MFLLHFSIITMMSHECHGLSNHQQFDCLFYCFIRLTTNNKSKLHISGSVWGESTCDPWIPLTKGPVMRQACLHHDINLSLSIDGLMQERHNSIANALELHLSCTNSLKWGTHKPLWTVMAVGVASDLDLWPQHGTLWSAFWVRSLTWHVSCCHPVEAAGISFHHH